MKTFPSLLAFAGLLLFACPPTPASEATAKAEEALDARLGLADKPFQINLAALRTRADLRSKAQVRTGLPSYDQQVESAQASPAALIAALTASPEAPQATRRPSASAPQPPPSQQQQQGGNCNFNVFPPVCN